jgi:hypothetical protein
MSESTSLSTGTGIANSLFREVEFAPIYDSVKKLTNQKVSDAEKETVLKIIDDWEDSIIKRLKTKGTEMSRFLHYFEVNGCSDPLFEDVGTELSAKTNTVNEFEDLLVAKKELEVIQAKRPQQTANGLDTSEEERLTSKASYELELAKYNVVVNQATRKLKNKEIDWKTLLKEQPEVKALIVKAHRYNADLGKFTAECEDLGQLAKINVSIKSETVRDALKEMVEFGSKNF